MNGGGDGFFPIVRITRAVESFVFTGNSINGVLAIPGSLFCPQAQTNPNREGAGAVADAIPVPSSYVTVAAYCTATGPPQIRFELAFVGGGAPVYRPILAATLTTAVTSISYNFPIVPAIRIVLYATSVQPFEIAVTWGQQ